MGNVVDYWTFCQLHWFLFSPPCPIHVLRSPTPTFGCGFIRRDTSTIYCLVVGELKYIFPVIINCLNKAKVYSI